MAKKKKVEISTVKDLLGKISGSGDGISEILGMVPTSENDIPNHVPLHCLEEIKKKLGEKKTIVNEDGNSILQPIYSEEEKVKVIFGLLSERGINVLDYLERMMESDGYHPKLLESINETMGRTSEVLRDIAEMQYRKTKLENERINLEIQKYKADLKKRELDIKEKSKDNIQSTNIIAVGSTKELLEVMSGGNTNKIKEVEVSKDVEE